jgi:hypothetical protein
MMLPSSDISATPIVSGSAPVWSALASAGGGPPCPGNGGPMLVALEHAPLGLLAGGGACSQESDGGDGAPGLDAGRDELKRAVQCGRARSVTGSMSHAYGAYCT